MSLWFIKWTWTAPIVLVNILERRGRQSATIISNNSVINWKDCLQTDDRRTADKNTLHYVSLQPSGCGWRFLLSWFLQESTRQKVPPTARGSMVLNSKSRILKKQKQTANSKTEKTENAVWFMKQKRYQPEKILNINAVKNSPVQWKTVPSSSVLYVNQRLPTVEKAFLVQK